MAGSAETPYLGQIIMVGFNFAPPGWAFCNGQVLAISQNSALFNLIGTTYGGDGQTTFALPDLRSRVPVHQGTGTGSSYVIGQSFGVEQVTLNVNQLPSHQHVFNPGGSQSEPTSDRPDGHYPSSGGYYAGTTDSGAPMGAPTVAAAGGGQPHSNIQPFVGINFIIAVAGVFPSQ